MPTETANRPQVLAAIDLGTNSCRLLIADLHGKEICKDISAIRLGKGMHENMRFTVDAMERGLKHFEFLKSVLDKYEVKDSRYVATAACRTAKNGKEFLDEVFALSGIRLEVIDGEEEARLTLKGAASHVRGLSKYILIYDIGGGSTEITLAENNDEMKIIKTVSIPWGARNSSEAFKINDYNEEGASMLRAEIKKYVAEFLHGLGYEKYLPQTAFIAASGTALRAAAMALDKGSYDREGLDGLRIDVREFDRIVAEVYKTTFKERLASPYIENRADMFVAPCIIFKQIYDDLNIKEMVVSLRSAKDGIIEELALKWQKQ